MRTRAVVVAAAVAGTLAATPAGRGAVASVVHGPVCASCHSDGNAIVRDARRYLGVPYVWGGESRAGMDCSGFTQRVYADLGVQLPRTAAEQQHVGTPVRDLAHARPGDLLFYEPDESGVAHHVAIYEDDGRLIEAPRPGMTVSQRDVYDGVMAIRRIPIGR